LPHPNRLKNNLYILTLCVAGFKSIRVWAIYPYLNLKVKRWSMKLNRKMEYSLMALKHMSQKSPGELTSAKEISDLYGCPIDATAKVLQVMTRHDLLKSVQGVQGGYLIQRDLSRLTFFDLIGMILGPMGFVKCLPGGHAHCEIQDRCNIVGAMGVLNDKIMQFYKKIAIKDLLEPRKNSTSAHHLLEEIHS